MTDRLAIIFGVLLILLITADFALNHGAATLFLAKKLAALIDYLQFWR